MLFILNESDNDPAMRYEGLARYAFDCERAGGPNNIADANVFDIVFVPDITEEGVKIINIILDELILKVNKGIKKELIDLKESLTREMSQESGIELIDYIIKLLKE